LSERTELVSIVNDCNLLRRVMKDPAVTSASYAHTLSASKKPSNDEDLVLGRGVQVLPVEWRRDLDFGNEGELATGGVFDGLDADTEEDSSEEEEGSGKI
jgi:hypothetical protein